MTNMERRIQKLAAEAQSEYTEDPVASVLRHLYHMRSDFEDGHESYSFCVGYCQAIHDMEQIYISFTRGFDCECRYPSPEKLSDGEWQCANCDGTLVSPDEPVIKEVDDGE